MTYRKGEANTPSHSVKLLALFIGYKMKRLTQEEFISRAIAVHGNKYNYGKVVYVGSQTPHNHLDGQTCPWCAGKKKTTEYGKVEELLSKELL